MFDQNATIKETDEDEDDLASEMINVEPGISFNSIRISSLINSLWMFWPDRWKDIRRQGKRNGTRIWRRDGTASATSTGAINNRNVVIITRPTVAAASTDRWRGCGQQRIRRRVCPTGNGQGILEEKNPHYLYGPSCISTAAHWAIIVSKFLPNNLCENFIEACQNIFYVFKAFVKHLPLVWMMISSSSRVHVVRNSCLITKTILQAFQK